MSIVVPCYNHGTHVGKCFHSLREQTYPNVEIVVVDDLSTDPATLRALDELEVAPNAQIIRNRTNQGIVATTNLGMIHSHGDWIAFVDCDDYLEPDAIERVVAFIERTPGCSFVFTDRVLIGPEGEFLQHLRYSGVEGWLEEGSDHSRNLLRAMVASHLKVVRRDAFLRIGLLRAESEGCQDYDMALRLAERESLAYLPQAVYNYRWHEDSVTLSRKTRQQFTSNRVLRAAYERRSAAAWAKSGLTGPRAAEDKALLVLSATPGCDANRVMLDLMDVLAARGWSITVALLNDPGPEAAGIDPQVRTVNLPVEIWDPSARVEFLKRLIRDDGIEVVHIADTETAPLLARALWDLVPRPWIIDTIQDGRDESISRAVFHEMFLDARIAASKAIEQTVRNLGVSSGRCVTIRNGVDLGRFHRRNRPMADRRALVFHGLLTEEEQPLRFVEIAALVAQHDPDVQFEIVGDGPLRDAVDSLVRERGLERRVVLHGWVPLEPILARARAVILPPDAAGHPIALCEAMASGVPVVAAAVGGIPEVISHGVNGLLVSPPDDLTQYASFACDLLDDSENAEAIGQAAQATAGRLFCRGRMADEVEAVYRLRRSRRPFFEGASGLCSLLLRARGCPRSLTRTLEAIQARTALPYELIILDAAADESIRPVLNTLEVQPRIRVVSVPDLLGEAEGTRRLAELARGDYVVLLDDATEVGPNWLESSIERLERDPRIGAAVFRSVLPDGTVEYTGGDSKTEGQRVRFTLRHHGFAATDLATMMDRDCAWVPGGMALYRGEVFRNLTLDLQDPGPFIDYDLSMQVQAAGYRLVSCPESTVIHHRQGPLKATSSFRATRCEAPQIERALRRFQERWGLWIWDEDLFRTLDWSIRTEADLLLQLASASSAFGIDTAA